MLTAWGNLAKTCACVVLTYVRRSFIRLFTFHQFLLLVALWKMKKKKRSRASKKGVGTSKAAQPESNEDQGEQKVLEDLVVTFGSLTVEQAAAACREDEDANKPAEIFGSSFAEDTVTEDWSTTCSTFSGNLASGSSVGSEVFALADFPQNRVRNQKDRPKRVVAAAGTVSTLLGKDYVSSVQKKTSPKYTGFAGGPRWGMEEAEQFLCSMLGEDCELSLPAVRDVLCQCGYDVEKALNVLLELSSSASEQSEVGRSSAPSKEDAQLFLDRSGSLTDRTSDSTSHSSENELLGSVWYTRHLNRNHSKILNGAEAHCSSILEPELPQKVLESLFNMPTPKSAERDPKAMNWRNIARKMASLEQRFEAYPGGGAPMQYSPAKGEEYQVFRQPAKQHWESMKFCYQKAATAFSNGERGYAAYMSDQGRLQKKRAKEAEEKASQDIFRARNKDIENIITIDLHGQHVKEAMRLLKLHLLFGAYVRSVRSFRVITGCGRHVGKSRLKQSVIDLLEREGIKWNEENNGTLLIRLGDQVEFSFSDSESENES